LGQQLLSTQGSDGSWKGESERWWENIPALDTAYALIALSDCQTALEKTAKGPSAQPAAAGASTPAK
jgi:hypothetical protein